MNKKIELFWNKFGKIFKNFSYNLSYQILSLILPIITIPYITSVISQELIGINAVVQAACNYFTLFGMLGITILGPREVAKKQNNLNELSSIFSKIYGIQFRTHVLALCVYIIFCLFHKNTMLYFWYIIFICASATDISWFFIGVEDFKAVAIRNFGVKIAAFLLLFVFVKEDADIYRYVLTLYAPSLCINVYMWYVLRVKKEIKFVREKVDYNILKESISLFIPHIASSIYTILDRSVLSLFASYSIVAIYVQAQTILRLGLAVVPSFSKVMMPRMSNCIYEKDSKAVIEYLNMSANVISALSFFIFFGVLAGAQLFVDWYLPISYKSAGDIIKICSPIILAVSGANLIAVQYLIPSGKQNIYTLSIMVSVVSNIILNFLLGPIWGVYGICIGSVVAECVGVMIQVKYASKYIKLKDVFEGTYVYGISGLIMFTILICFDEFFETNLKDILLFGVLGFFSYLVTIIIIKKIVVGIKNIIN